MSMRLVLIGWICLSGFLAACGTAGQDDKKDRPQTQVIGHGTKPGSSWLGLEVTVPLPGKTSSAPPSTESGSDQPPADKKQ